MSGLVVEGDLERVIRPEQIARRRVHHTLGLAGRAAGVEDEQGVLGGHRLGRAICRHGGSELVIPDVARPHRYFGAGRLDDDDLLQRRGAGRGFIDGGLELDPLAAAAAFVGGDDDPGAAILDAAGERIGGEAAEHHRMNRPDPRAGKRGIGCLGDHRHVERDPVAFHHALCLQHVGEAADLGVQFAIRDLARFFRWLVRLPDDRDGVALLGEMAVDAVGSDVELAIVEPFDVEVGLRERPVAGDRRCGDPVEPLGRLIEPEAAGVACRCLVQLFIFFWVETGVRPIAADRIDFRIGHALPREDAVGAGWYPRQ
jgi:hypothetical protein